MTWLPVVRLTSFVTITSLATLATPRHCRWLVAKGATISVIGHF
jgi:hypothetical protein